MHMHVRVYMYIVYIHMCMHTYIYIYIYICMYIHTCSSAAVLSRGARQAADAAPLNGCVGCVGMCMRSSCLCFDASAVPWCTETWRTNKGFPKDVLFPYLTTHFRYRCFQSSSNVSSRRAARQLLER